MDFHLKHFYILTSNNYSMAINENYISGQFNAGLCRPSILSQHYLLWNSLCLIECIDHLFLQLFPRIISEQKWYNRSYSARQFQIWLRSQISKTDRYYFTCICTLLLLHKVINIRNTSRLKDLLIFMQLPFETDIDGERQIQII